MNQCEDIFTLYILVTTNCNLNCLSCAHGCDHDNNPYYLSLEELENILIQIKKNQPTIKGHLINNICLTGGDPLTHPQIIQFCKLIRFYFPDIFLNVSTNGILLLKYTEEELLYFKNVLHIDFSISIYPDSNLLKIYEKLFQLNEKHYLNLAINDSHFYFSKQSKINNDIEFPRTRFQNDKCDIKLKNHNYVIFFKNNIYNCWCDIQNLQKHYPFEETDNLNINNLTPNLELAHIKKHSLCTLCDYSDDSPGGNWLLWQHTNNKDFAQLIFENNLLELFLNHYDIFYKLEYDYKNQLEILNNPLFLKFFNDRNNPDEYRFTMVRFLTGEGDIFIPFNKKNDKLQELLLSQKNIEKYNIYLISLNTPEEEMREIYNTLPMYDGQSPLNIYYLKAHSLYDAYNQFIEHSHCKKKILIDIQDLTPLENPNFLNERGIN